MARYVSTRQLSSRLGLSTRTIRRHVAAGKLAASQFSEGGRFVFDLVEVRDALRRHRKGAPVTAPAGNA